MKQARVWFQLMFLEFGSMCWLRDQSDFTQVVCLSETDTHAARVAL